MSKIKNIDKFFENSLSAGVEKIDCFNFLKFNPKIDIQLNEFLAPAIGLALRGNGMASLNINLMPAEHLRYKRMKRRMPYILGSFIIIFLLLGSFFLFSLNKYYSMKDYLKVLDGKISNFQKNEKTVNDADAHIRSYRDKIEVMRDVLSNKHTVVFVLEDIASAMPGKIWIKSLNFDLEKKSIALEGNSIDDLKSIGEFQKKLQENGMIKNVKIETVGKLGNNLISFSMSISLK